MQLFKKLWLNHFTSFMNFIHLNFGKYVFEPFSCLDQRKNTGKGGADLAKVAAPKANDNLV